MIPPDEAITRDDLSPLAKRRAAREKGQARGREIRSYMKTSAAAYEIGLSVLVGMVGGLFFDKWLGTAPWGFLWFSIAGALNAGRTIYSLIQRMKLEEEKEAAQAAEATSTATQERRP